MNPIDWSSIRPLDGGQDKGFEELCSQLARTESPPSACFERKGTPDAGVECYAVLKDGSEWGWQAKYFDGLGDSQWSQIDKSVIVAIEKHPRLARYFVCTPIDRPDARIEGRRSAKDKWDDYVKKWTSHATEKGMTVEFVYWGSHELLERLARPEHVGRVRFWFDVHGFDAAWFSARLDEAIRTAGPRYTPEVHVDLPIASELETFGRTDLFFERVKSQARAIRDKMRTLMFSEGTTDATVDTAAASVSAMVQVVLKSFAAIQSQPAGPLPFKSIIEQVISADQFAQELSKILEARECEFDAKAESSEAISSRSSNRHNPYRERRIRLFQLASELQSAREALTHAEEIAGNTILLLRGLAGTGKTHLLCDFARQRVASGRPTVLLMGQRFVSSDPPWSQTLQHLDLAHLSAEEFIGALEASAQSAGSRALLIVDALNEGAGRAIWPSHLAAFLAHLERSPWIGVVLAIRSSYEEIIIPAEVRERAATVTHEGFSEHEYDATKTFFVHYGLELPSTPLLAPEFKNPLFLKSVCRGLSENGECRLPRGFQGITTVFDLYLSAINSRLAINLDFDKRTDLVRRALEAIAKTIVDSGKSWLPLDQATEIVNGFLPNRSFEQSLYRGLVVEGVLVEDATRQDGECTKVVVFIGYERFADHLAAKTLLDRHLDLHEPACSFAQGNPLAFVCDKSKYVSPGLLEAMCIQIPERIGKELVSIAPICAERWGLADAFRQSIVWRTFASFSDDTRDILNRLCRTEHDQSDTIDMLLTVATLPGHPLNARFLDRRFRRNTMPDRDAWWSVYLHHARGVHGAVDRLVDWASSQEANASTDQEAIDLCAISLAWMLTTSNRFLRDRATMALVSLLTGNLPAVVRLVEGFVDVDDPYVTERVYAVAYGVAMRSHDPVAVGALATCVYASVFSSGSPPPHILLRDYARGVVERALYLKSAIDVVLDRIRPPYKSIWPTIPSDEDVKPLLPDWSKGTHDSGDLKWSWNQIGSSVMSGDFAHYVIGTNSSSTSRDWLSLTLDEAPWAPLPRPEDQLSSLISDFSAAERKAWEEFESADMAYAEASRAFVSLWFAGRVENKMPGRLEDLDIENLTQDLEAASPPEIAELEEKKQKAADILKSILTKEHMRRLEDIQAAKDNYHELSQPPGFDLHQIQRYILKRVFDMGWTEERFGHFDRFSIRCDGREASKAERIGKKYQWIAYHEIMAFIADHFQYREQFGEEEGIQAYEGPWQDHLRDIDPSCTMRSARGGTSWDGHAAAWWGTARYNTWGNLEESRDWVLQYDDLPRVEDLLIVTNPADGSRWLNGQGYFTWTQPPPADRESTDVERREVWYICTGYLVRTDNAQSFLKWAESVDFMGRWMPEAAEVYGMFLGEHSWAPASRYFQKQYYGDDGWTQPNQDCPVKIRTLALEYHRESSGFDCSVDEGFTLRLPVSDLVAGLGIRWSGRGADFVDDTDRVAAQDPTAHGHGPSALLLREDLLSEFLARENLTICWTLLGEKRVILPGFGAGSNNPWLRLSGAYQLSDGKATGFVKYMLDDPTREQLDGRSDSLEVIHVARTQA